MGTEAERTGQEASSLTPIHSCIDCYCSFVNHGISSLLRSFFFQWFNSWVGGWRGVKVMTAISTLRGAMSWPGITKSGSADVGEAKEIFFLAPFLSQQMGNTNLFQHNSVSAPPHFCHLIRCKLPPLRPEVNSPHRHTFGEETDHLLDSCFPLDTKFRVFAHRQD